MSPFSDLLENPPVPALRWKLAAMDIDDTLVGPDRIISAANRRAIADLRERGVLIVLASGRSHANMLPFHAELRLDTPLISANGALVREAPRGPVWAQHGMPAPLVTELIEEGRRRGLSVLLYALDGVYVDRRTSFTEYDQSRNDDAQIRVPDLCAVPADGVHKVLWMAEPEAIASLTPEQTKRYHSRLTVTHTDPPYLEFMPPDVTKATGLADVARHYGIDARDVVAFGDGNNDVGMLQWAGLGIAMNHAKPALKAAADFTVPKTSVSASLAKGIEWVIEGATVQS
ncbi:MAG: Cof-type HAD-IIB family hydrolase [Bryobacterales bacterium]|nr:Cof-type HAD-IIB family hydrolase [Bryobacterales bacterium]